MKNLTFFLLFSSLFFTPSLHAQNLDWVSLANYHQKPNGTTPFERFGMCVDGNNNTYIISHCTARVNFGTNITADSNQDFIASYDKHGKIKWVINPKGNCSLEMVAANGNNIVVAGYEYDTAGSSFNGMSIDSAGYFILKIDTNGTVKWLKTFDTIGDISALTEGSGGITYFSGFFYVMQGTTNFMASLDSLGNIKWASSLATSDAHGFFGSSIFLDKVGAIYQLMGFYNVGTQSDSIIVNGKTYILNPLNSYLYLLIKLHANGSYNWVKSINWLDFITVNAQGDIYTIHNISKDSLFHSNSKNTDSSTMYSYIIKLDSSATPRTAYITMNESVVPDNNGHLYEVFIRYSDRTLYVVNQYSTTGILNWSDTVINQPYSVNAAVYAISPCSSGNIIISGTIDSAGNFPMDTSVKSPSTSLFIAMLDTNSVSIVTSTHKSVVSTTTFSLYPNPTTQNITLKYSAATPAQYTCIITDLTGREIQAKQIHAKTGENTSQIDVSQLNAGMYILSLQNGDSVHRVKFIKE